MIALDDVSALRFEDPDGGGIPAELDYRNVAPFEQASLYERDLDALEEHFRAENIAYRVFSTTVAIRSAKWTTIPKHNP